MQKIFPQPSDYLAPMTEKEKVLLEKWKSNELGNEKKNAIKIRLFLYLGLSTTVYGLLGIYLVNSIVKDMEKSGIQRMEKEASNIIDNIKRADFKYARSTEISNQMLKILKYKQVVQGFCCIMGLSYGLAQMRMYIKEYAENYQN
ncbi:unnamed protein product [Paramecium pentaurelia]|uniref:Uncharacterized protein n=1 Tax=Paramecium pentaurelia TaxID=43138 RepID=A0A8S1SGB9_9CILI|nr:unnamed protein product [Paramecium pentaurelia]